MRARIIVAFALVLAACDGESPAPQSLIAEPRVLAVRAEPPVVAPGELATLDALVVDDRGARLSPPLTWRACDPWRFVLDPDQDCGPEASLPLDGALDPLAVLARFPPPVGSSPPLAASGDECAGRDLSLPLPVVVETDVGGQRLVAIKTVLLVQAPVPATNPGVGAVLLDGDPDATAFEPGREYEVSVADIAVARDDDCDPGPPRLLVQLYTTGGDIDDDDVGISVPADQTARVPLTTWRAPEAASVALWILAIDSDGGVGWTRHELHEQR